MALVSVVMPIYNAEKYLAQAIESVLNQTLEDFQLVLVNDGSKDTSLEICEAYAKKDARIKVINQGNGGICAARNRGVTEALGEYLAFIDNDDVYLPDLLEENYRLAKKYDADILKYGYRFIKHKKFSPRDSCPSGLLDEQQIKIIKKENIRERYKQINNADLLVYVWDGLFKTAVIKQRQVVFDTVFKAGHEDRVFCMQLYPYIDCFVINPKLYYKHIVYKSSASMVFSDSRITDTEILLNHERNLFDVMQLDELYPFYWQERVMTYIISICSIFRKPEAEISFVEILTILNKFRTTYYNEVMSGKKTVRKEKRFKNRKYAKWFEDNKLTYLAHALIWDRQIKKIQNGLKNIFG